METKWPCAFHRRQEARQKPSLGRWAMPERKDLNMRAKRILAMLLTAVLCLNLAAVNPGAYAEENPAGVTERAENAPANAEQTDRGTEKSGTGETETESGETVTGAEVPETESGEEEAASETSETESGEDEAASETSETESGEEEATAETSETEATEGQSGEQDEVKKYSVTLKVLDREGQNLLGAEFVVLTKDAETGEETEVESWVSSEEQPVKVFRLDAGIYILKEKSAPEGYVPAEELEFSVSEQEETGDKRLAILTRNEQGEITEELEANLLEVVNRPEAEEATEEEATGETTETEATEEEATETAETEATEEETETETETEALPMPAVDFKPQTVGDVTVTVSAPEGAFPEGTTMTVAPVTDEETLAAVAEAAEVGVNAVQAVDISFYHPITEEEIQPLVPITVSITTAQLVEADESAVVHVDGEGKADVVAQSAEESAQDEVLFETKEFSVYGVAVVYTVDFYYTAEGASTEYHMTGGSSMLLSELFEQLGIQRSAGSVTELQFTDESLVSLTAEEGDWRLTSLQPFTSAEVLTVIFDDDEILEIAVEDAIISNRTIDSSWVFNLDDTTGTLTIYVKNNEFYGGLQKNYNSYADWNAVWKKSGIDDTDIRPLVKHVVFKENNKGTKFDFNGKAISYMFSGFTNLEDIDFSGVDPCYVRNVESMFQGCAKLKSVDLGWMMSDGGGDATQSMKDMFNGCSALESVTLNNSEFVTRETTDEGAGGGVQMQRMFQGCTSLKTVDMSNITIHGRDGWTQVTGLFQNCTSLETVKMNGTQFPYVRDFSSMFEGCTGLTEADLSNARMDSAEYLINMFKGCTSLKTVNMNDVSVGALVNVNDMFQGCTALETLNLKGFDLSSIGPRNDRHYVGEHPDVLRIGAAEYGRMLGLDSCTALKTLDATNAWIWVCYNNRGLPGSEYYQAASAEDIYYFTNRAFTLVTDEGQTVSVNTTRDYIDLITDRSAVNRPTAPAFPDEGSNINAGGVNNRGAGFLPSGVYTFQDSALETVGDVGDPETYYRIAYLGQETPELYVPTGVGLVTDGRYVNTETRSWGSGDVVYDLSGDPIKITYPNAAIDVNGKRHGVEIAITKVTFKNVDVVPEDRGRYDDGNSYVSGEYYRTILVAQDEGLIFRNYVYDEGVRCLSNGSGTNIDFTVKILDANEGTTFAFHGVDLDVAGAQEWDRPNNDACYDHLAVQNVIYNKDAEGFILGNGNDTSSLILGTGLTVIDGNHVIGTGSDPNTEWSAFSVKADAQGASYTWTSGIACDSYALRNTPKLHLDDVTLHLTAQKLLENGKLNAGDFEFELFEKDEDGAEVNLTTARNSAGSKADDDSDGLNSVGTVEFTKTLTMTDDGVLIDGLHYFPGSSGNKHNTYEYTCYLREKDSNPHDLALESRDNSEKEILVKISTPENDEEMAKGVKIEIKTSDGTKTYWSKVDRDKPMDTGVTFTNTVKPSELTVEKKVTDLEEDKDKYFAFSISLSKLNMYDGSLKISGLDPEAGTDRTNPETIPVADGSGGATVYLKHGQKAAITLPYGAAYTVSEVIEEEGYKTSLDIAGDLFTDDEGADAQGQEIPTGEEIVFAADSFLKDKASLTFTNEPTTVDLGVTKIWDHRNNEGELPKEITFTVKEVGGEDQTVAEMTLKQADFDGDTWTGTFEKLREMRNGEKIKYQVSEKTVDDYTLKIQEPQGDQGWIFTNTYDPQHRSIEVEKHWSDDNDRLGMRPASVTVALFADNVPTGQTLELNADNLWEGEFESVAKYNENGVEIQYTVKESPVPEGYTAGRTIGTMADGFAITNTIRTQDYTVAKVWDDAGHESERPSSVIVRLHDGQKGYEQELNEENDWSWTFENLPEYRDGFKIEYSLREDHQSRYIPGVEYNADEHHFTLTNTYIEENVRTVPVAKDWFDEGYESLRPAGVTVELYADGAATGKTLELSEANRWFDRFTDVPDTVDGREIVYTVREVNVPAGYTSNVTGDADSCLVVNNIINTQSYTVTKVWNDAGHESARPASITVRLHDEHQGRELVLSEENNWTGMFRNLPVYRNGEKIDYSLSEDHVPNYTSEVSFDAGTHSFTVTNTYNPGKRTVPVAKDWFDAGYEDHRPASVTVELYADGVSTGKTLVLSHEGRWIGRFMDLPETKGGKSIQYTVVEKDVPDGYVSATEGDMDQGFVLKNTFQVTDIRVAKFWVDAGHESARPQSLTVRLHDTHSTVGVLSLSAENGWSGVFHNLPVYRDGVKIEYSITEDHVPNYTPDVIFDELDERFEITNTYNPGMRTVPVVKDWFDAGNESHRPASITVELYADGAPTGKTLELNHEGRWIGRFNDLPETKGGKVIAYTVVEKNVPAGYVSTTEGNAEQGFILKNTYKTAEPTPTPSPTPSPKPSASPKTGDSNSLLPWLTLLLISGSTLGLTVLLPKKRKQR